MMELVEQVRLALVENADKEAVEAGFDACHTLLDELELRYAKIMVDCPLGPLSPEMEEMVEAVVERLRQKGIGGD